MVASWSCILSLLSFLFLKTTASLDPLEPGCPNDEFTVSNSRRGAIRLPYRGKKFSVLTPAFDLHYGQVHNKQLNPVSFPPHIIEQFKRKTMSITGYKIDLLRRNQQNELEPVPISELYNHHYIFYVSQAPAGSLKSSSISSSHVHNSRDNAMHRQRPMGSRQLDAPPEPSNNPQFQGKEKTDGAKGDFVSVFSEANGGEFKCSYHGYGEGYAQKVNSPHSLVFFAHMISTRWHANATTSPPLPRSSWVGPQSDYSGLIECPCTDLRTIDRNGYAVDGKAVSVPFGCSRDLKAQGNPSCSIRSYQGGLRCCEHHVTLLDHGQQEAAWPVERYQVRVTFWYEPEPLLNPAVHNLFRLYLQTEGPNNEYDIARCPRYTPASQCVHTITNRFSMNDFLENHCDEFDPWCSSARYVKNNKIRLVYASGHLHVGAISMELIDVRSGQTICLVKPIVGTGHDVGNVKGYLSSIPPCVWSMNDDDENLLPAPWIDIDAELLSIAKYNSTTPHYGVMAQWSMRGSYV